VRVQDMPVARYRTRVRRRNAPLGARGLPRPVRGRRHGRSDGRVAVIRRPRRTPGDRLRATGDPVTRIGRPWRCSGGPLARTRLTVRRTRQGWPRM